MALDWYPQAEKFETTKLYPGNQGRRAVVIHIAQGGYAAAVKWLQDAQMNPNSSAHYVIAKDGRVAQLVSVNDGAWANGLKWNTDAAQPNGGYWTNARGVRVTPSWKDIVPGQNPNFYTISVEHEGFYQEAWTPEMYTANNDLLVWIGEQFDLWWVPYRNLIGHYAIDNIDRPNCPGPTVNLETMAADANTARLMKMVVPQPRAVHVYGTTALLSLPTRTIISQLRDTDVEVHGYIEYGGKRWYITPYSFDNKQPYFFEAAATVQTPALFPSLSLNPGYRDSVTPSANELRDLAPQWVRVLLFQQYQNATTGQNTELDWLIDRAKQANPNIKILALINPETLNEVPPPTGSANWSAYITKASNLARQVAQFYRGKIHALEVWNEPDVQQISPENYAALLNASYPKIKAVNPDLPVISAGICCGEAFEYLRRVVAVAPNSFDFAGWHMYAERADGYPFAGWGFGEIRNSINQARAIAGKPLWITEVGALLDYNWGSIPPATGVAEYMKRAFAVMNDVGRNQVAHAFWFTWRIAGESWGMVDDAGTKRPAWFTFQELARNAPPPPMGTLEITNVMLTPTTVDAGQVLNVSITVRNGTNATLPTQAPAPNLVYNEGETFLSRGFAEVSGAYRVGIDFQGRAVSVVDHPYRWGLGAALAPNETRTITGQIRLNNASVKNYWAGLVQEKIAWKLDNAGTTQITVRPPTPQPPTGKPTILSATFTPVNVTAGQMLNVSITVRNDTNVPLVSQGPNPNFTYLEGESFQSHGFTEQRDTFRVGVDFDGRTGIDHPYRWGFGGTLNPGETRVVNGSIRLNAAGTKKYWAGLVREQVQWIQDNVGTTSITVGSGPTPPPSGTPTITNVQFVPTGLEQGQIVQVKITVKNDSSQTMTSQGPNAGFLYNEGDNFLTKGFAPVSGTWRVGIDYEGRPGVEPNAYPYRWGLGTTLAPGQSAVVVGFVRLNRRQSVDYWAGLINETNTVVVGRAGVTRINVVKN